MKNLTQSLERVAFSFSVLSMMSAIELSNLLPALASTKTYNGEDANVTVTCNSVDQQSTGNFSIDGRKSGTGFVQAGGVAYFDNDPRSAKPIFVTSLPTSILNGDSYDHGLPAINFGALIAAVGEKPDGSFVISLPDLSENPDKAFGYTLDCPPIPTNAGGGSGGDGSGGDGGGDGGTGAGGAGVGGGATICRTANGFYVPRLLPSRLYNLRFDDWVGNHPATSDASGHANFPVPEVPPDDWSDGQRRGVVYDTNDNDTDVNYFYLFQTPAC